MFNLDDCFALITSRSGKVFATRLEGRLASSGITRAQWIAMYYIYNSECITQRCLADKMTIKEPTVVRMIQKMEYDGFICRSGCHNDKRKKYLKLTEKGSKIYLELLPVVEKFKDDTIADISDEDLKVFKSVIEKMVENTLREDN